MLSESARATAPGESRYRIAAPNSRPRAVTVVALDGGSEDVVVRLAAQPWASTVFWTAAAGRDGRDGPGVPGPAGWLRQVTGRPVDLAQEIGRAHLVVMIATAGCDVPAAGAIGTQCRLDGVTTVAVVVGGLDPAAGPTARTMTQLRPHSRMLVVAASRDYVADLLVALRA